MTKQLVACAIADIHLSAEPPRFRSVETDWLGVQRKYLEQVFTACYNLGSPVPLLIAGDLFDKAQPTPEIINFALDVFGKKDSRIPVYAIPGNHDLPNHRYEDMKKSAYGTLVETRRIIDVPPKRCISHTGINTILRIWGFPCGAEASPRPPVKASSIPTLDIALVHSYIWTNGYSYPGADTNQIIDAYRKKVIGYDIAIFGDNHKGFAFSKENNCGQCSIVNCGTLLVRKSDEIDHRPAITYIYSDGSVERRILDTKDDKYADLPEYKKEELEPTRLEEKEAIQAFASIGEQSYNFAELLRHIAEKKDIRLRVKELILESVGKSDG